MRLRAPTDKSSVIVVYAHVYPKNNSELVQTNKLDVRLVEDNGTIKALQRSTQLIPPYTNWGNSCFVSFLSEPGDYVEAETTDDENISYYRDGELHLALGS